MFTDKASSTLLPAGARASCAPTAHPQTSTQQPASSKTRWHDLTCCPHGVDKIDRDLRQALISAYEGIEATGLRGVPSPHGTAAENAHDEKALHTLRTAFALRLRLDAHAAPSDIQTRQYEASRLLAHLHTYEMDGKWPIPAGRLEFALTALRLMQDQHGLDDPACSVISLVAGPGAAFEPLALLMLETRDDEEVLFERTPLRPHASRAEPHDPEDVLFDRGVRTDRGTNQSVLTHESFIDSILARPGPCVVIDPLYPDHLFSITRGCTSEQARQMWASFVATVAQDGHLVAGVDLDAIHAFLHARA